MEKLLKDNLDKESCLKRARLAFRESFSRSSVSQRAMSSSTLDFNLAARSCAIQKQSLKDKDYFTNFQLVATVGEISPFLVM